MSSYKVFGIKGDNTQTNVKSVNNDYLHELVDEFINNPMIKKIVIIKEWT